MIEAAKHQARLRKPQGDGKATWKDHLEALVRTGRRPLTELEGPEVSPDVLYLWRWFLELLRTRSFTEVGREPLTYQEIAAWADRTGRFPMPHEVEALMQLDLADRFPGED